MYRNLMAAALAAAALVAVAAQASAAPADTINRTFGLVCKLGATDGAGLKANQIVVRNTTGRVIPEKALIKLVLTEASNKRYVKTAMAYRALARGETMAVGPAQGFKGCIATVTLQPNLKAKIDAKVGKLTR